MIDIYKYKDAEKIELTDINGNRYLGSVISINPKEDEDEDYGLKEDSITIAIGRRPITFCISEVSNISLLD